MTKIIDMLTDGDQLLKCLSLIYMSFRTFNSLHAGNFFLLLLSSADFYQISFKIKPFRNTIRGSNG